MNKFIDIDDTIIEKDTIPEKIKRDIYERSTIHLDGNRYIKVDDVIDILKGVANDE